MSDFVNEYIKHHESELDQR